MAAEKCDVSQSSTNNSDDCESTTLDHMEYAKSQFNKNRKFIIKNVPPVSYEEVKEFVGGFQVSNISISKKCRHAIVTLLNGQEAEEAVFYLSKKTLLGTVVQVSLLHNENLLCVTHLPFNLHEKDFKKQLEPYGNIEKCFLMKNAQTGASKGYGFVEYVHNKEKSLAACKKLDGQRLGSCIIQCSFLGSVIFYLEELQSTCLLIDHLPDDYNNIQELKNICSFVEEPMFCELGERNGKHLGFAIVDYHNHETADKTQNKINGYKVGNNTVRVTYCRPGDSAFCYLNEIADVRMKTETVPPLMPPGSNGWSIVNQYKLASPVVKKLLAENPDALGNFVQVLETLQMQQQQIKPSTLGLTPQSSIMNPNLQIALLAVLMSIQIQQSQPNFLVNPNTQEYILNSLQNQQHQTRLQSTAPSVRSPLVTQANTLLQNVMLQNTINSNDQDTVNANAQLYTNSNDITRPFYELFPGPEQHSNFDSSVLQDFTNLVSALTPGDKPGFRARTVYGANTTQNRTASNMTKSFQSHTKDSLNNTNNTKTVPSLLGLHPSQNSGNLKLGILGPPPGFDHRPGLLGNYPGHKKVMNNCDKDIALADPVLASFIENQIKQHVAENKCQKNNQIPTPLLNHVQNKMESQHNHQRKNSTAINSTQLNVKQKPTSLMDLQLGDKNTYYSNQSLLGNPLKINNFGFNSNGEFAKMQNDLMRPQNSRGSSIQSTPTSRNKPQSLMGNVTDKRTLSFDESFKFTSNHNHKSSNTSSILAQPLLGGFDINIPTLRNPDEVGVQSLLDVDVTKLPQHKNRSVLQSKGSYPQSLLELDVQRSRHLSNVKSNAVKPLGISLMSGSRFRHENTPQSLKRKFPHLIPSPEASPDGRYIGQHSQGLGGHYAATYHVNKKIKII